MLRVVKKDEYIALNVHGFASTFVTDKTVTGRNCGTVPKSQVAADSILDGTYHHSSTPKSACRQSNASVSCHALSLGMSLQSV